MRRKPKRRRPTREPELRWKPAPHAPGKRSKPSDFIAANPVFRREEFAAAFPGRTPASLRATLAYHVQRKRLVKLRPGLFKHYGGSTDSVLIGGRLTPDAVVSHLGALYHHGLTGLGHFMPIISNFRVPYFCCNEVIYRTVHGESYRGIIEVECSGLPVKIATKERALSDCLVRMDLGVRLDSWVHLLLSQNSLDLDALVRFTIDSGSAAAVMRLALCLPFHRRLPVTLELLQDLEEHRPRDPIKADPGGSGGVRNARWNAVTPLWLHRMELPPVRTYPTLSDRDLEDMHEYEELERFAE